MLVPFRRWHAWREGAAIVGTKPPSRQATHGKAEAYGISVGDLEQEKETARLQKRSNVLEGVLHIGGCVENVGRNNNLFLR